jgi:chemotaxis protein histidine kinase CheA
MTTSLEKVNGSHAAFAEPRFDPTALAKAEAIRIQANADADARRIQAEAEAKAVEIKAHEEAERQRLANDRAALRAERERAEQGVKIAEANRKAAETDRLAEAEARKADEAQAAEEADSATREKTATSWRRAALAFAVLCALVALPVQVSAFYSPQRPYLGGVPIVLEVGAWVVLKGAAAAVTDKRPHWHYRLIAWCIAAGAAAVNLAHGVDQFDLTTAIATAVASIAGPGIWDLHEHGRIRIRDGKATWWERRKERKAAESAEADRQALEKAAEKATAEKAAKLAAERAAMYPKEWAHALKLAAALGDTTVTETIWKRAYRDINGTDPGESVEIINGRNAVERRLIHARSTAPGEKPVKVTSSQRASQMPPTSGKRIYNPPARSGIRRKGDTPRYVKAANKQAAIAAKNATLREGETA